METLMITSLSSPRVTKLKTGQFLRKLWAIKEGVVFYEILCR